AVAKCRLPRPPAPPRATTTRASAAARSATTWSSANTCVPTGTRSSTPAPSAPCLPAPRPGSPRRALNERLARRVERSRSSGSATSTPSPPSGPPLGTNFSRRKLSPPSPPRPACTWMRARSWNTARTVDGRELAGVDDRDRAALAARPELDLAVLGGEDRVVAADARTRAGPEASAALAHEDHPGLNVLAGEDLHAEHLRIRVAPVARGAEPLLVSHRYSAFFLVVFFAAGFFAVVAAAFGFAAVFGFSSAVSAF